MIFIRTPQATKRWSHFHTTTCPFNVTEIICWFGPINSLFWKLVVQEKPFNKSSKILFISTSMIHDHFDLISFKKKQHKKTSEISFCFLRRNPTQMLGRFHGGTQSICFSFSFCGSIGTIARRTYLYMQGNNRVKEGARIATQMRSTACMFLSHMFELWSSFKDVVFLQTAFSSHTFWVLPEFQNHFGFVELIKEKHKKCIDHSVWKKL